MCFIRDKVDVATFIVPLKGKIGGKCYDAPFPPRMEFTNNPVCTQFEDFISTPIIDRFKNGSLVFWGKVGEVRQYCTSTVTTTSNTGEASSSASIADDSAPCAKRQKVQRPGHQCH